MEERNFDLLRPFDLEAAKRGEQLMRVLAGEWMDVTFVAEGGDDGDHAVRKPDGNLIWGSAGNFRMAPLARVEGKPVYKGDVLYDNEYGTRQVVRCAGLHDTLETDQPRSDGEFIICFEDATWTQPKVKREV